MSEKLTPQQKMAIENRGGKLLVSAAAGSGKTKVLVDRLMSYLLDPIDPANLDDFLIITYTKAAASELRGKISEKLTNYIASHPENKHVHQQIQRLHMAKISTVHSFCADILREYAYRLDISADFRIAEENECHEIMRSVLERLLDEAYTERVNDEAFLAFVNTQGLGRDDHLLSEIILQIYSSSMCHLNPSDWLDWCLQATQVNGITDAAETIWGSYLIQDLKNSLSLQIRTLERCVEKTDTVPGLEKPTITLLTTIESLKSLNRCCTWDEIVNHPSIEYGRLTFTKEHRDTQIAEQIKTVRNACKDSISKKLRVFSDKSSLVFSHLRTSSLAVDGLIQLVKEFNNHYSKVKSIRRVLDFTDIEQKMLDLLYGKQRTGLTSAASEIGMRYREIMVDEYQDSNEVQDAIFSALTHKNQNCFMVGDVKQSIYQFRLADPGIFLKKYNDFCCAENAKSGEGRKILLSNNFRSSAGVISAVNDVFSTCMSQKVGGLNYGEEESLHEGIPHIQLSDREVELHAIDVQEDTYAEEAAFVCKRICQMLDGKHMVRDGESLRAIRPDDIVILLRSPGSVGGEFRYALEQAGITCHLGGDLNLLQQPEIECLCSILQIIHNPLQDIPLIAALSSPIFGFTADELAQIRGNCRHASYYHALQSSDLYKAVSFIGQLTEIRNLARHLTISQLIHCVFTKTGMLGIYGAMDNGDEKVRNLQYFCQFTSNYEATGHKDLTSFLLHLTAMEDKGLSIADVSPSNSVRIMSIHKSKGLEFPVVFLCGLSRVFNMTDTQKQVLCHKDLGLGLVHVDAERRVRFPTIAKRAIAAKVREESVSEELRVLYVAMTRARDRLIMTFASPNLQDRLLEIALRLDLTETELMTSQVNCPGNWVLQTALQRTEAGVFFHISHKPDCASVHDYPWMINVVTQALPSTLNTEQEMPKEQEIPHEVIENICEGLAFRYSYQPATTIPSKLTATQLKGRLKDAEVADSADNSHLHTLEFRTPTLQNSTPRGTDYGNAFHCVMQHLDFASCNCVTQIRADIDRMIASDLITEDQGYAVQAEKIANFFALELGQRLINSKHVLREFKFSIMEDAKKYYDTDCDDQILLQGIVDCAIIDEDEIIIIDFKTDYVNPSNLAEKIKLYRSQVQAYAGALSKIFEKPVTGSYLYFFSSEQLIEIT